MSARKTADAAQIRTYLRLVEAIGRSNTEESKTVALLVRAVLVSDALTPKEAARVYTYLADQLECSA